MPRTGGPYLVHAAICEKVLQEPDGVLSLIRVIDRVTVNLQTTSVSGIEAPVLPQPLPFLLTFAVSFKSGTSEVRCR